MDEADGLGAFVGSVSVFSGLLGLAVLVFAAGAHVSTVVLVPLCAGVAGFVESTRVVTDDVVLVDVDDVVVVLVCVTGAGDGELLCNCGDELFEPRSTDEQPRFELRKTRCCFCSSPVNAVPSFLSSVLFVESDGLVQRDDALSLSAESLLFDDDATTYGNAALLRVEIFLPLRVPIS